MKETTNRHRTVCLCQPATAEQLAESGGMIPEKRGQTVQTSYEVFPGIKIIYKNIHIQELAEEPPESHSSSSVYVISHCRQGRVESAADGHFFYLDPGDLVIYKCGKRDTTVYFPTSLYQGVSISIDMDCAPKCFSCLLNDVNVYPGVLLRKLCGMDGLFVARSNEHLEHVFSELYHIPEEVRKGYLKIKVLEIFLFLSCFPAEISEERKKHSMAQAELGKKVARFLTQHITEQTPTIQELSRLFHVSPSQLKNSFKGVYSVPVHSYIRTCKMKSAAAVLLTSDKTVLEIANMYSYGNASKFAKAFADVMGVSPAEYRKSNLLTKAHTVVLEP